MLANRITGPSVRLCPPLYRHNAILVSALHLARAWPQPLALPPALRLLSALCFLCPRLSSAVTPTLPWPTTSCALLAGCPVPMPWCLRSALCPRHASCPHFACLLPDTLPPSAWGVHSHANTRTPSQVRTCLFTCTHSPLAKAPVPWPSRLRGNQFIGILGWGVGTKGALFEFM